MSDLETYLQKVAALLEQRQPELDRALWWWTEEAWDFARPHREAIARGEPSWVRVPR